MLWLLQVLHLLLQGVDWQVVSHDALDVYIEHHPMVPNFYYYTATIINVQNISLYTC